jgi:Domain of unknown function (DUF4168)
MRCFHSQSVASPRFPRVGLTLRWFSKTALIGVLATTQILTPIAALKLHNSAAYAQTVTNEEVRSYAEAVLVMEEPRLQAYSEISDSITSASPDYDVTQYTLSCPNANTLKDVPRRVRAKARRTLIKYCNQARALVEEKGLTVNRFNAITAAHRQDAELLKRIQVEVGKIRSL